MAASERQQGQHRRLGAGGARSERLRRPAGHTALWHVQRWPGGNIGHVRGRRRRWVCGPGAGHADPGGDVYTAADRDVDAHAVTVADGDAYADTHRDASADVDTGAYGDANAFSDGNAAPGVR